MTTAAGSPHGEQGHTPLLAVLTGGVASGKSTVSEMFEALGVPVIDTDLIARELVEPGSAALEEIRDQMGDEVIRTDDSLDRRRLREKVFADARTRRQLEKILHPRIERRARRLIAECGDQPYVLLVVPLLAETGLFQDADCVIVVDAPEPVQSQRLVSRDRMDEPAARRMIDAQASRQERLAIADEVLDNTGTRKALEQAVKALHGRLLRRCCRPGD